MCGAAMRGADALPGSKATSRMKGTRRNLGDLIWSAVAQAIPDRDGKARSRSRRGTGEESDAPHSTCEAPEQNRDGLGDRAWAVAEGVEGRGRGRRERDPTTMGRAQYRKHHGRQLGRKRTVTSARQRHGTVTSDLRQEPGAGKPHAGICAGGGEQSPSLPRPGRPPAESRHRPIGRQVRRLSWAGRPGTAAPLQAWALHAFVAGRAGSRRRGLPDSWAVGLAGTALKTGLRPVRRRVMFRPRHRVSSSRQRHVRPKFSSRLCAGRISTLP